MKAVTYSATRATCSLVIMWACMCSGVAVRTRHAMQKRRSGDTMGGPWYSTGGASSGDPVAWRRLVPDGKWRCRGSSGGRGVPPGPSDKLDRA